jgi:hypothetical protein
MIRQEKQELGIYDDARSDDKSVEPESVVTKMGDKTILFVGLERADAVMVYDVSNPASKFYRLLKRVMRLRAYFIPVKVPPKKFSGSGSEGDGVVKIFQPDLN